jgi:hypothetical protein
MHVRQVALVARDLEPVVNDLRAVFDVDVAFRDPGVAAFGLHNAVMPIGHDFLEVVSPVRDGTAAGRLLDRRGGDAGYMVIIQTADLAADRDRLATLGVRVVWEIALEDIATVHLHPRDVGGAIVSLDEPRPPASWRWAGPTWQTAVRTAVVRSITGVAVAAVDPAQMAARWAEVLGLQLDTRSPWQLCLDLGVIRFVAAADGQEGVVGVALAPVDAPRAFAAAAARGLHTDGHGIWIGGVRFALSGGAVV